MPYYGKIERTIRSEKRDTYFYHWTLYNGDDLLGFGERDHKTREAAVDELSEIVGAISRRGINLPKRNLKGDSE